MIGIIVAIAFIYILYRSSYWWFVERHNKSWADLLDSEEEDDQ